ncbi:MAG: glycine--tRNA ligase [Candidatus Paceibacterota bacterium]|jgi:glycyl-tRNA synthetase|nr:glycine--tRNA ligase [Candidatus Paceibacterota bacterium]
MENQKVTMDKIESLAKRRGFIYRGSEIYGGLAGTWDYGPLGVALKKNIKDLWWKRFVEDRSDMYGVDAAILMSSKVWEAAGHVATFTDPMVECEKCKKRFRADHLSPDGKTDFSWVCSECGHSNGLFEPRQFNMMFKTSIGAVEDSSSIAYLRPETAQGMFVNFKNVVDSFHPRLPFGMGQIGKAFRNEITPRDFVFRTREFEQMEIEYFVKPSEWEEHFELWRKEMHQWMEDIGLRKENIHELEVADEDLAHYSKRTIDFEFDFPFGKKELYGLAYRTDFDLTSHQKESTVSLEYIDEAEKTKYIPHVVEPTFGLDRTILAVLCTSYHEEDVEGETRAVLRLPKQLAPIKVAILPLSKKEELSAVARPIFDTLKKDFVVSYDETQSIGKRYRRQDEIGTPYCITVDFETLNDKAVTVRDRDTMKQERIAIEKLPEYLKEKFQ